MPSDPKSPPLCAHVVNAVPHSLCLPSAFINSCDNVNNEIQAQVLGMKLTPHKNLDIQKSSSFEVAASKTVVSKTFASKTFTSKTFTSKTLAYTLDPTNPFTLGPSV
jgi:hypothetical protein